MKKTDFRGADIGIKPITVDVILHNNTLLMQAFKVFQNFLTTYLK